MFTATQSKSNSSIATPRLTTIATSVKRTVLTVILTSTVSFQAIANNADPLLTAVTPLLNSTATSSTPMPPILPKPIERPRIQLAILLDTSGSMDGLIDQTRNQLWQVVNEFATATRKGVTPILEVALFEYGNDGNPKSQGFVRKLSSLTRELDSVSEGLFSLTTNGGSEYCGFAIRAAVNNLQWSDSNNDIKTIFIAGNEPFTQGPVNYQSAIELAKSKGISVNTIHAGDHQQGIATGWRNGAMLAGGDYMSIDHNRQVVHIEAPQDKKIAQLNNQLNQTYIPYGSGGKAKAKRQQEQDKMSSGISTALLAQRAQSKASAMYKNSQWDLVDALEEGEIAEEQIATMEAEALPEPMQDMSRQEKKDYIQQKAEQRRELKQKIARLSRERQAHIAQVKKEKAVAAPSISDALTEAVKKQAAAKDYQFKNQQQQQAQDAQQTTTTESQK